MFRVSQRPSSGALKTVTATSGIGHSTGTATSFQRGLIRTLMSHELKKMAIICYNCMSQSPDSRNFSFLNDFGLIIQGESRESDDFFKLLRFKTRQVAVTHPV